MYSNKLYKYITKDKCRPSTLYGKTSLECIPTCSNPDVDASCKTNTKESCPCNENEVVLDRDCIPRSSCKCTDADGIVSKVNVTFNIVSM